MGRPMVDPLFLGREAELHAVESLLAAGERLITLRGPGGAGKTQLALRALARVAEEAAAPRFVDLAEAKGEAELVAGVAAALDLPISASAAGRRIDRVGRALADQGVTLLLLDNLEQVVEPIGPALAAWLAQAPELRLLVTSRRSLGVECEVIVEVGPLGAADAIALFEAVCARSGAVLSPSDREPIAPLVAQIDCLPLAIRLAAARAGVLSTWAILDRLDARFDLLRRNRPGDRHASLREVLESSFELLDGSDRDGLTRLSILRGSFSTPLAEAIIGADTITTLDMVQRLRECSLLRSAGDSGSGRLVMYESVRELARELLTETEREAAMAALARHLLARCRAAGGGSTGVGAPVVAEVARADLDAAIAHLVGVDPEGAAELALAMSGAFAHEPVDAGVARLAAIAARLGEGAPGLASRVQARLATLLRLGGRLPEADAAARAAVALAPAGDDAARAQAHWIRGHVAASLGDDPQAGQHLGLALALARRLADAPGERRALMALANLDYMQRRLDAAGARAAEVSRVAQAGGDATAEGFAEMLTGLIDLERGSLASAGARFERARALYELERQSHGLGCVLGYLASWRLERGEPALALAAADAAVAIHRPLSEHPWVELSLITRALAQVELDRPEAALASLVSASAWAALADDPTSRVGLAGCRGAVLAGLGRTAEAEAAFAEARIDLGRCDAPLTRSWLHVLSGALDVAAAEAARRNDDAGARERALAGARRRLDDVGTPPAPGLVEAATSYDLRGVCRLLERALAKEMAAADVERPPRSAARAAGFVVARDASWFEVPGGHERVYVDRPAWRRLLLALVHERLDRRGEGQGLTTDELVAAGWPDERLVASSGRNRAWVALSGLRAAGIEPVLVRRRGRYLVDPDVETSLVDA